MKTKYFLMPNNGNKIGLVKWFDRNKGFGIIETSEKKEYFLHTSNIELSDDRILIATPLIFEIGKTKQEKTTPAINCRIPSSIEDFKIGLSLIGKKRELEFEVTAKYKSRWGNPYSKREKRTYDILDYFFHKILFNRTKAEIIEMFKTSFDSKYQRWNANETIDFYRITKDRIHSLKFDVSEFELSEDETTGIDPNDTCQYKLTKELIDYYNSLIDDRVKIVLWKSGELSHYRHYDHFNIFGIKLNLPFDDSLLLSHADIISPEDFATLDKYKISESTYDKLTEYVYDRVFAQNIVSYVDLKIQIRYFEKINPSRQKKYFNDILSKIPEELLFDVWFRRKIYIDRENKEFKLYFPPSCDYRIPIDILEEYIEVVDSSIVKRLVNVFDDLDVLRFLLNKYNNNLIHEKNIIETLQSIKKLSKEQQVKFIETIFDDLYKKHIGQLLEYKLIQIKDRTTGKIFNYNFEINDNSAKSIIDSISDVNTMSIEDKISIVKMLNPDSFEEDLLKLIPKTIESELFEIYRIIPTARTFKQIQDAWSDFDLEETYDLLKIALENNHLITDEFWTRLYSETDDIPVEFHLKIIRNFPNEITVNQCIRSLDFNEPNEIETFLEGVELTEEKKNTFFNKFQENSQSITISNLIYLAGILQKWKLPFKISDFNKRLNVGIDNNEFLALILYFSALDDHVKLEFEDTIINYINQHVQENEPILEECISIIDSSRILETVLRKCTDVDDSDTHIENLRSAKCLKSISLEFIGDHLSQFITSKPIGALNIAVDTFPDLYNILAKKICLDKQSFIDYLKLLNEKFDKVCEISKGDHELNLICLHFNDPYNEECSAKLQSLFANNSYAFQIDYVKFLYYQYYLKKLSKEMLFQMLNGIKLIQLSALLLREFITTEINSRDDLMNCMNNNLKNHFCLLLNESFTEKTLQQIFTIDDLVKCCNGRKKYLGLEYWKRDNIVRWYTEGNHRLVKKGYEKMFCEGRFWHKQPFYYSSNKKPTAEKYDFFWCKNDYCAKVNDTINLNDSFETWTLNEINEVSNINLDRLSFTYVAGWINRMKSIFDRLTCKECGHYLRPKHYTPKKLGYYAVPLFNCINDKCSLNSVEIRFTHCIGCGKILDSRECKTCMKCNWLICDGENCNRCGCGADHNSIYAQY